ncbi:hypothetical protein [Inquilinus sp. CA228]|uniref:hypothetical protein n=1 Tax=Inquilinus sp. CA228 TaxID=3455609 RepID=UPI003F8D52E9
MNRWLLVQGGTVLGTLRWTHSDFPFDYCRFEPAPAFSAVEPLFAASLQALKADDGSQFEQAYERIEALGLALVSPDGAERIDAFLLNIDGEQAWFRS